MLASLREQGRSPTSRALIASGHLTSARVVIPVGSGGVAGDESAGEVFPPGEYAVGDEKLDAGLGGVDSGGMGAERLVQRSSGQHGHGVSFETSTMLIVSLAMLR